MACLNDNSTVSLLQVISGFSCLITILPSCLCAFSITMVLKNVHANLKRLMYIMSFLFIARPIVQTSEIVLICANGDDNSNVLLYIHCLRDIVVMGIRFIWLEIGIERIVATVFVGTYEKSSLARRLIWVFILLAFLSTAVYTYFSEFIGLNIYVTYGFLLGTAIIAIVMFSVIRRKNQTFRQLSNLTGERALKLTEKYQIIENIRSMDYLIPHSNIDAVTDVITVVASFFGRYFYDRIGSAAIYNMGLNVQMLVFTIYWSKKNLRLRKLLKRSRTKGVGPLMTNASRSAASEHRKDVHFVKNPLGDRIKKNQTPEEHFISLKTMWK